MELYPVPLNVTGTPVEPNHGCDAETSTLEGTEPILFPVAVITSDPTTQLLLPPTDFTTTFTDPVDVVLGAEMTGGGISVDTGTNGTGVGDGDGYGLIGTRS